MTDLALTKTTCQSMTRKGRPCNQPAIPGYPYCIHHLKAGTVPATRHDRYSDVMPNSVGGHYQHQLEDANPRDLTEEIAGMRAMLSTFCHKLKQQNSDEAVTTEALVTAIMMMEKISTLVEKHAKVNPDRVLTVTDVMSIITRIVDIIIEKVPQEQVQLRNQIVEGIHRAAADLMTTATTQTVGSDLNTPS